MPLTIMITALSKYLMDINVTTVILAITVLLFVRWYLQQRHLPPGPWGLPFVGVLFTMNFSNSAVKTFTEPAKIYGGIYCFRLGNLLMYVLSDYEIIKEAYGKKGDIFNGENAFKFKEDDRGLGGNSIGEEAKQQRKFVMSVLRDFGMGKQSIEPRIMEEVHNFLQEIGKTKGNPIDPTELLSLSNTNIVSSIIFGERFQYEDLKYLKQILKESSNFFLAISLPLLFPIFKYVPFISKLTGRDQLEIFVENLRAFMQKRIDNHIENHNDSVCRDYIDAYLSRRKEIMENSGSEEYFDLKILVGNLISLYVGASETTTTTLRWAMLYMLLNPDVALRVQKEIDDVIGPHRDPSMKDRANMPFTEATILEVQRCASVLPMSLMRKTTAETWVLGYRIPAGSYVSANYMAVHYDEKMWSDTESFKPQRFINTENVVEKPEYLLPFSLGKRSCVGESLARMQLFLYFTSFLQRFHLKPVPNKTYNYESELKISRMPKPFEICAVKRDS